MSDRSYLCQKTQKLWKSAVYHENVMDFGAKSKQFSYTEVLLYNTNVLANLFNPKLLW